VGGSFWDDKVGARFYARSYDYDGQHKNTLTNQLVGNESTDSTGLYLTWRPIEDLSFATNIFYREDDDGPLALFLQPTSKNNCKPGFRSSFYRDSNPSPAVTTRGSNSNQYFCGKIEPGTVALNTDPIAATGGRDGTAFDGVETSEYFGMLRADWDIGGSGWTATSLSGYRSFDNRFGTDSDHSDAFVLPPSYRPGGTPVFQVPGIGTPQEREPLFANTNRDVIRSKSTELRIASPQDNPLRGLVGYYWYDYTDTGRDLTFANSYNGVKDYVETIEDQAVFGMVSWNFWEGLTITAELRYMEETKERTEYCSTAASTGDFNPWTNTCTNWGITRQPGNPLFYSNPLGTVNYNEKADFDSTTPRVTLDWQVNPDNLLYLVFAQGVKPGGLNGLAGQRIDQATYDQEESDNWEIGNKLFLFDRRVRLNTALYWIDASDVQFTQSVPNPGGTGAITSIATNQGAGETYGFELDSQTALTDAVTIGITYSYTHTEITEGCDDFEFALNSGGVIYDPALGTVPECNLDGNQYPLVAEQTASFALNYDSPLSWGEGLSMISNFTTSYEGSKYVQVHNLAETGATTLVNLRLGVRSDNGWRVELFGRNLTDSDTIPLATRWFDLRTGSANAGPPCTSSSLVPCGAPATSPTGYPVTAAPAQPGGADVGAPRAPFGALRQGRTFGIEFRYDFRL
jgi:outer membrane receptor protein involved in Fe transport